MMQLVKGTAHSFKWSRAGKPGKVMIERMAFKKPKALGRKKYQQPMELIVKSKKKLRVN